MDPRRLPVLNGHVAESSIHTDGTRKKIHPADFSGRFLRARRAVFALLILTWLLLPIVHIGGHPALFLDVEHRRFFAFGGSFTPQDFWLVFFLATGVGFGLVYATAVLGRVWCGWACPQTVFLEGLFRPIERLVNGPRDKRMRGTSFTRRAITHVLYVLAALFVAHVFLSYFVSVSALWSMITGSPSAHPEAFIWMVAVTGVFYGNFAFFREQTCVALCPYGRLQSVLLDDDSLVVGYDEKRGEPRGKKGKTEGDCVDCGRCVVVCPTGIDIRNGLQMDCIACTQCIDACDDIMDKLERPRGLIRYDSLKGLRGEQRRFFFRPRIYFYTALAVLGAVVFFLATRTRTTFEATLLRQPGAPFTRDESGIRNGFVLHIANKGTEPRAYDISPEPNGASTGTEYVMPMTHVDVAPMSDQRVPFFVTARGDLRGKPVVRVRVRHGEETKVVEAAFLGGAP